jgi:hypothetical protein
MIAADKSKNVKRGLSFLILSLFWMLAVSGVCWAAFGEDIEKPKPEFTREDPKMAAKLIPRGKTSSIRIEFQADGGRLLSVEGVDFDSVADQTVDRKDFRSAFFAVKVVELPPGGEVKVSMASAYFTGSTQLWVVTPNPKERWANSQAETVGRPSRLRELALTVKDGGPFDSDGKINGEITLIAGPKDSFWGYALGTLFIRFFGIFLVLGMLQAGMLLTGAVFQRMERRPKAPKTAPTLQPAVEEAEEVPESIEPEAATAIGVALHLHLSALRASVALNLEQSDASSWARQGRTQIMRDRMLTHDRAGRK